VHREEGWQLDKRQGAGADKRQPRSGAVGLRSYYTTFTRLAFACFAGPILNVRTLPNHMHMHVVVVHELVVDLD